MPSFDVVSEVDKHELRNAVDQANRELERRFDFRGVTASFTLEGENVLLKAPSDFQIDQMRDILDQRLSARGLDLRSFEAADIESNLAEARQTLRCKQGIEKEEAKEIIKMIKDSKIKVTAQINDNKLRVTGKKRDDLQATIALLKKAELELPLQFENFRD